MIMFLNHQFLNHNEQKGNRPLINYFSLCMWKTSLGTVLLYIDAIIWHLGILALTINFFS